MHEDLYPLLTEVIKENFSWIRITDTRKFRRRYVYLDGCIRTVVSRALTLRTSVRMRNYRKGHEWHISEDEIGKAILRLRAADSAFAERIDRVTLTPTDAKKIIEIASHGILKLKLYDE